MKNDTKTILSNFDLIDLIKRIGLFPLFRGVYSKDQLDNIRKLEGIFIVNLDDFSNGGTHWVAVSTIKNNVAYYDSYGSLPPNSIDRYIKSVTGKKKYLINNVQIQSLDSTYCGWFAVFFLYFITNTRGKIEDKMNYFNDLFNSYNLDDNYNKLLKYFTRVFKITEV